jgi:hypothetical protein
MQTWRTKQRFRCFASGGRVTAHGTVYLADGLADAVGVLYQAHAHESLAGLAKSGSRVTSTSASSRSHSAKR